MATESPTPTTACQNNRGPPEIRRDRQIVSLPSGHFRCGWTFSSWLPVLCPGRGARGARGSKIHVVLLGGVSNDLPDSETKFRYGLILCRRFLVAFENEPMHRPDDWPTKIRWPSDIPLHRGLPHSSHLSSPPISFFFLPYGAH